MNLAPREFFGPLKRRKKYAQKTTGELYSYEYYRQNFRDEIAEDCVARCVYCDCHEDEVGGRDAMEIDHFRPWSIDRFAGLKNEPTNYHHACGRCNRLKGDEWPCSDHSACHDGTIGFVDPFNDDRRLYFLVEANGTLTSLRAPATYMISLLQLNRPLLTLLRLRRNLRREVSSYIQKMLPEIEAATRGEGSLTREQLATEWLKLREFYRLLDLCDAPLNVLKGKV